MRVSNSRRWAAPAAAAVLALTTATAGQAAPPGGGASVTDEFAEVGGAASGSTIGPDGALYVTNGATGEVWRIDPDTGDETVFAAGLPTRVVPVGGPMDVVFHGGTAYVLTTLAAPTFDDIFSATEGVTELYRVEDDGSLTLVVDIGAWSAEHPPPTDIFIPTGVAYAIERFRGGFLVADGHHNRVLRVGRDGAINELVVVDNVVPTGLETQGRTIWMAEAGPTPHLPEDGRVVAFSPGDSTPTQVAVGAPLLVDVERGRGQTLFALSQGDWDGAMESEPALPETGRLVRVHRDGTLEPVRDGSGDEVVLDRPTSMELVGNTAYVVQLDGSVVRIDDVASPPYRR